ncbi:MAG: hypothetical protein JWM82_2046 [Myxococcales bacterium]|nr:hypothetical protein [Myxococcales bacterium]
MILTGVSCGGATVGVDLEAFIVDGNADRSEGGCQILHWDPHHFAGGTEPLISVAWTSDAQVVLSYPERLDVSHIGTRCGDIAVDHVLDRIEEGLRGYVCLDPGGKTLQPCGEAHESRWALLNAEKAAGWQKVTATLEPGWKADPAYFPLCRWQMVYVEMNGAVRKPGGDERRAHSQVEVFATAFTYAGRKPRGECRQLYDGTP